MLDIHERLEVFPKTKLGFWPLVTKECNLKLNSVNSHNAMPKQQVVTNTRPVIANGLEIQSSTEAGRIRW